MCKKPALCATANLRALHSYRGWDRSQFNSQILLQSRIPDLEMQLSHLVLNLTMGQMRKTALARAMARLLVDKMAWRSLKAWTVTQAHVRPAREQLVLQN